MMLRFCLALLAFAMPGLALAQANPDNLPVHMPKPWQLGFQDAATPVMEQISWLHNTLLMYVSVGIVVFVLGLMLYIAVRFSRRANPVASKTSHNTLIEVVWTVVPIFILIAIAIPSLRAHYFKEQIVNPEMTLKVVGHQWYWSYEYPDFGNFAFDSIMKKDAELQPDEPRLLAVDNAVVVPIDTVVRVQMTGADVTHSWAVPAFGLKKDAMPGRLNETWFKATKSGRYYGQCSELCGVGHGFMPIVVDVVSKDQFAAWVTQKQKDNHITPSAVQALPVETTAPAKQ